MEQELLTLLEHLSSPLVFSGVRVTRSLVLCVCFVDRCLSFCTFFLLAIVLYVFLQFTDSDYPFGIFKLFLTIYMCVIRRVSYKKNSLLTLREHLSSPAVFIRSMLLIVLFFCVILSFVCLRYVSCVPNVTSVGGLSISDCISVFYVYLILPPFNNSACTKLGK